VARVKKARITNFALVTWKAGLCQIGQKLSAFSNQPSGLRATKLTADGTQEPAETLEGHLLSLAPARPDCIVTIMPNGGNGSILFCGTERTYAHGP
jgi:hypothetical protein